MVPWGTYTTWLTYEGLWKFYKDSYGFCLFPNSCKKYFLYWSNILTIKWETVELRQKLCCLSGQKDEVVREKFTIYFDFSYDSSEYKIYIVILQLNERCGVRQFFSSHFSWKGTIMTSRAVSTLWIAESICHLKISSPT